MAQRVKAHHTSQSWNPQWKERTNCLQSGPLTPHVHIPMFTHISYTHTTTKYKVGVKRSLSDQEHLLFLYKTWLLLPAPTQQLTTIYITSVQEFQHPLLVLVGTRHVRCTTDVHAGKTSIHTKNYNYLFTFILFYLFISDFPRQGFSM